ncbi:MAG: arylsulfotransferase family protein [Gallionella sp.]|nr:arylsulfotransferase family protein [Gallionella sp.]
MKKAHSTTTPYRDNHAFGWKFWLWLTAAVSAVLIVAVISTAWAVRHVIIKGGVRLSENQARMVIAVAEFPGLVFSAVKEVRDRFGDDPSPLLMDRKTTEQPYWVRSFPSPKDTGYLLFSGVDPVAKHSIVQLIRISDGAQVARWDPDWVAIFETITEKKLESKGSPLEARAMHPVLLADGDIIFNNFTSLVRLSPCNSKPVWVFDEVMHHSNEIDESGSALWVPSVAQDGLADNPWLRDKIRDDALAHVSTDGRLLEKRSFARILRDNGMESMLLGMSGLQINSDPIHINQIKAAHQDSRYWQRGDLLISARHLSTLFLYRPSTDKIIWHQTGPWMNQHSVDFVDDHSISVFNNNVVSGPITGKQMFMKPGDTNQVLVYDFDTKQVSQPFAALLAQARPVSVTEGRARLLPDGGLFLEDTNYGRDMRFTKDRMLWSRVNDYDNKRIGAVSWSRYLTAEEASMPLKALASRRCQSEK